jgi:iron complex outermembrane receptor protein
MIDRRWAALAAVSISALLAGTAQAQDPSPPPIADTGASEQNEVSEIVVTGTRVEGRTRLDTVSPVDVISDEALARQGTSTELAQALANTTPSINFPRPAITDGSDHVRPATLRGLAPDQTLVLINGTRGHIAALVAVNGSIGRGSTAFDLNTIPTVTLGAVEVLRDGASAQYGADAIAGVINLRLRQEDEGGYLTGNYGIYNTRVTTARGRREIEDGATWSVAGWKGLKLGSEGFLTVSGEYVQRDPTNRSDLADPSAVAGGGSRVLARFGDPELESLTGYVNAGLPLNETWELYGVAGYQDRTTEAAATHRPFNDSRNVPAIYPLGFTPIIGTDIIDYNLIGGLRGEAAGFNVDLNVSFGGNELDYTIKNTLNTTFGPASQRTFNAGGLGYDQLVVGVDVSRPYDLGLAGPLNVAFGAEYRRESFEVTAGEPSSYSAGTFTGAPVSQGFGGFGPNNVTDVDRDSIGVYVDLEGEVADRLTLGAAARFENYSDFGETLTGKLSGRYDVTEDLAFRGAISTGFKAPALQQQFFSYTSTNLQTVIGPNGQPVTSLQENGTFRVVDAPAIALGARQLEPETSTNYALGVVFSRGPFELTVDGYQIEIEDRIVLSETLGAGTISTTPAQLATIRAILAPFNVTGARFFVNGVETTTKGIDVVARYRLEGDSFGRFDLLAAANLNDTKVDRVPPQTAAIPQRLVDRNTILTFEEGTPERKLVFSVDWALDNLGATIETTSYESVLIPNNNSATLDYSTGSDTLLDVEGRYEFPFGVDLALGVNNLTDAYPQFTPIALNGATGSVGFPSYSPFGFNGRFFYARLSYSW